MNTFTPIDLAQLPDPAVVEQIDYETILAERKAYAVSLWPAVQRAKVAATLALESEPLTKLLQENAYRETLWRQRVNEASLAMMLAKARGTDLEQLAGNVNVSRLTVTPADPAAVPPIVAVMESDDSLRERAQMAWEGLSTAGPRNSYILHARSADGRVADATADSPSPAVVVVTVQGLLGDGSLDQSVLDIVSTYLSDDDRRPVADRLTVQAATILPYAINAILYPASSGPEADPILAAAETSLKAFIRQRRRLGVEVSESAVHAALHVEGMRKVVLEGWVDLAPTASQAAYCTGYTLTPGTSA
ncbi:baseplate J/gp47 family protein [Pseudomonas sp. UBA4194]|uniref:baseplate J/gp47 family protein n=1 Tax=Pseudomonas sp. UBA4194 TaxID=1947317 RepID=UPI0025E9DB56|nr:baseplate J/gp47 family protein [Pseudomonas sp. UBA4194]